MGIRLMFGAVAATLMLSVFPMAAGAQARFEVKDATGKVVGLFEYTYVMRPEGHFASSQFFKGAKAVESRKGMKPVLRSHFQANPDLGFEKYTRWETSGIDTTEYKVFKFKKEIKMRVAKGEKGKVSVLGKTQPVFVVEPDQPHLAIFIADRNKPEYTLACINTKMTTVGKATVKCLGPVDSIEPAQVEPATAAQPETAAEPVATTDSTTTPHDGDAVTPDLPVEVVVPEAAKVLLYTVEGDCGRFKVWIDDFGVMVKAETETQSYEIIR